MDKISELFLICLSTILLLKIGLKCVNVSVFQKLLGDVKGLIVVCFMPYNAGRKGKYYFHCNRTKSAIPYIIHKYQYGKQESFYLLKENSDIFPEGKNDCFKNSKVESPVLFTGYRYCDLVLCQNYLALIRITWYPVVRYCTIITCTALSCWWGGVGYSFCA